MTAKEIIESNGFEVQISHTGFIVKRHPDFLHMEQGTASYGKALRVLCRKTNLIKLDTDKIRVYCQTYDIVKTNKSAMEYLEEIGFIVIKNEYSSFGAMYFFEVVKTEIKLPSWAEYY